MPDPSTVVDAASHAGWVEGLLALIVISSLIGFGWLLRSVVPILNRSIEASSISVAKLVETTAAMSRAADVNSANLGVILKRIELTGEEGKVLLVVVGDLAKLANQGANEHQETLKLLREMLIEVEKKS